MHSKTSHRRKILYLDYFSAVLYASVSRRPRAFKTRNSEKYKPYFASHIIHEEDITIKEHGTGEIDPDLGEKHPWRDRFPLFTPFKERSRYVRKLRGTHAKQQDILKRHNWKTDNNLRAYIAR